MITKGQKISDRYEIVKSIGEGGMANVFLAYDTILERNVAVKVLRGDLANDEKFVRRFQREALQASSLSHKNIVEVYDVGEDNGEYYIVMEYVEGKTLKNLLKKRGKLTIPEVVDIMYQVTDGLATAHDLFIIHRDIKPQNIMILENGLVKLTDFGIALAINSTQLTQTNSVMGSVHYLPPEQASGKGATLQSDIYSLGILMYELLTGKLPFRGENAVEIALKQLKEPMPSIRTELPDVPQSIENIILRATAKNPKNRYADAREMNEDLKTCLDESRKVEDKVVYKYPESDFDLAKPKVKKDTKVTTKEKVAKKSKDNDEVIATQITDKELKKDNKLLIKLLAIFTGIVVLITTIVVLLPYLTSNKQISVPDVSNLTEEEATNILQDSGFEVGEIVRTASDSIDENKVIKTSPVAGTHRKEGSSINIYISTGVDSVEIEDYTGMEYNDIYLMLTSKGINVEKKFEEVTSESEYTSSQIVGQSVTKGMKLTKGDYITLYVPLVKNVFPDFINDVWTISDILDFCSEYSVSCYFKDSTGSKTLTITEENVNEYDNYKVIYQSREAGKTIGSSITFRIDMTEEDDSGNLD